MIGARRFVLRLVVCVCALVGVLGLSTVPAFAAAPEPPLLVLESSKATEVSLHGYLYPGTPGEPGSYELLYKRSASECEGESKGAGTEATGQFQEVSETLKGLQPGGQYTFCLLVSNGNGETGLSVPLTVTLPVATAPVLEQVVVGRVTSSSATFSAQINPQGAQTTYTFEEAPTGGPFIPVGEPGGKGVLVGESANMEVSVHVQNGLAVHTGYEFRLVAGNSVGQTSSAVVSFTTQRTGTPFALADNRSWEMVSPTHKEGALFGAIGRLSGGILQAAADGNAFTDWSFFEPIEPNAASTSGFLEANFFGRGEQEWSSKTISPPHKLGSLPLGNGMEYRFFSEDLSKAILQPFGPAVPLAPEVSQATAYIRTDFLNGDRGEQCTIDCYQPLVSDTNVPPGTQYGEETAGPCKKVLCGPEVAATSPDLDHVLLTSPVDLTGNGSVGATENAPHGGLYEWSAGRLTYVGTGHLGCNEYAGNKSLEFCDMKRHVISGDGSRVFLDGSYEGMEGLLMREPAAGRTVRLDTSQGSVPQPPPGAVQFEDASADGSRVFFTDEQPLTEDSSEGGLYEYDANAPAGNRLADLGIDPNPGEAAGVSSVLGVSEDGSYVYFAATGVLATGASPATCSGNQPCMNLYVRHDGVTSFIAGLGSEDYPVWNLKESEQRGLFARVSPDGHWLAFMSNRDLTGYDTADAVSGRPDEEIYLYDAEAGKVACASCDPTGASPVGAEYGGLANPPLYDGNGGDFATGTWMAAILPPWTDFKPGSITYQSRYLSDGGRLFFDSHDALVPQDVNGAEDVYEYEPADIGDCTAGSVSFSAASGGCASLVSSGESDRESVFLDASENGSDVFFLTSSKLVTKDTDNAFDIYDARECGPEGSRCFPREPVSPPPCDTGDACKPAPTPQPAIFGAPSSSTFSGTGNVTASSSGVTVEVKPKHLTRSQQLARALKQCARLKKPKQRTECKRKARARYAATSKPEKTTKQGSGR